jgi:hypothetical protein
MKYNQKSYGKEPNTILSIRVPATLEGTCSYVVT